MKEKRKQQQQQQQQLQPHRNNNHYKNTQHKHLKNNIKYVLNSKK